MYSNSQIPLKWMGKVLRAGGGAAARRRYGAARPVDTGSGMGWGVLVGKRSLVGFAWLSIGQRSVYRRCHAGARAANARGRC